MMDPLTMVGSLVGAGANLIGGLMGRDHQKEQQARNEALQREFAQNALQWKVADAKKAGIHPLYAMGAPSISPAVSVSGDPMGPALSGMGANIGRAINAMSGPEQRESAFQLSMQALQLERAGLENQLLASRIRTINQAGSPPAPPIGTATESPSKSKVTERGRNILGSREVRGHPGYSATEGMSDEYGDENPGVQYVYGPMKMLMDYMYHQSGARSVEEYRTGVERDKARNIRARGWQPIGRR